MPKGQKLSCFVVLWKLLSIMYHLKLIDLVRVEHAAFWRREDYVLHWELVASCQEEVVEITP